MNWRDIRYLSCLYSYLYIWVLHPSLWLSTAGQLDSFLHISISTKPQPFPFRKVLNFVKNELDNGSLAALIQQFLLPRPNMPNPTKPSLGIHQHNLYYVISNIYRFRKPVLACNSRKSLKRLEFIWKLSKACLETTTLWRGKFNKIGSSLMCQGKD